MCSICSAAIHSHPISISAACSCLLSSRPLRRSTLATRYSAAGNYPATPMRHSTTHDDTGDEKSSQCATPRPLATRRCNPRHTQRPTSRNAQPFRPLATRRFNPPTSRDGIDERPRSLRHYRRTTSLPATESTNALRSLRRNQRTDLAPCGRNPTATDESSAHSRRDAGNCDTRDANRQTRRNRRHAPLPAAATRHCNLCDEPANQPSRDTTPEPATNTIRRHLRNSLAQSTPTQLSHAIDSNATADATLGQRNHPSVPHDDAITRPLRRQSHFFAAPCVCSLRSRLLFPASCDTVSSGLHRCSKLELFASARSLWPR
jgi:hypothetical protein